MSRSRGWVDACNDLLDRLPCKQIRLGDGHLSTFMSWSIIGLFVGSSLFLVLVISTALDLILALVLIPIALTASLAISWLRKRVAGVERWVLLQHFIVTGATVAGVISLVGGEPLAWLDVFITASTPMYAIGRIGCAMNGCCHGKRSSLGIDYGPRHAVAARCFPVQLLDAALWIAALGVAWVCVALAPAGTATALVTIVYCVGRLVLERLRGDVRPRLWGISTSTWLSLLLLAGACALLVATRRPPLPIMVVAVTGFVLALGLWLSSPKWLARRRPITPELASRIVELGRDIGARGPDRSVAHVQLDNLLANSSWMVFDERTELYLSLSSADPELGVLDSVTAELALEHVMHGLGVTLPQLELVESTPGVFVTRVTYEETPSIELGAEVPAAKRGPSAAKTTPRRSEQADAVGEQVAGVEASSSLWHRMATGVPPRATPNRSPL